MCPKTAVVEIIMSLVGFMMALSCAPQILQIIERKSSADVSILTTQNPIVWRGLLDCIFILHQKHSNFCLWFFYR